MIPAANFNPSFANLAALHGLGGMRHPLSTGGPIFQRPPATGLPVTAPGQPPAPMAGMPAQQTMPMQGGMPGPMPQGNLGNLNALMQMFGQR